ncbi:MAG TPA: metallophosphoesterase [Bellilinea sp.]|nr:metallophosphoesterase [Bellilinea sp.]
MRIAVLADIHGNLPAFEAALKQVSQQKVDQIILAGDIIVGSPDSKACWDLALSLGCPILRGNHERYAAYFGTPKAPPEWLMDRFAPLHWAVAQLSEQDRQGMEQLPLKLRSPDAPDLFIVHATERDDHDTISSYTPEKALHAMFPTSPERYIVRAHNHIGQVRVWEKGFIVTAGSVGLPQDGNPTAQYLLLDQEKKGWIFRHLSVPYDVDAAISRFHDTGYFSTVGPMAHLFFLEVLTASQYIVPFLRLYTQWSTQGEITLAQAVERFLAL